MKRILITLFMAVSLVSCNKNQSKQETDEGNIIIEIYHTVDGKQLETDQMIYTNAAGNKYLVSEIQWIISDIKLHRADGSTALIGKEGGIFYIDTDIPESMKLDLGYGVKSGDYTGLSFTFGMNELQNKSLRFVNPPESFMFWPDYLGGGYHYMKLNGKWINTDGVAQPFNFHLGIGQVYDTLAPKSSYVSRSACCASAHCEGYTPPEKTMPIIGFIQNYFDVRFEETIFSVQASESTKLKLEMKVDNWFKNPNIYDHNIWGGSIMQQQKAMKKACENSIDVFSLTVN